jgi:hypothetical protein
MPGEGQNESVTNDRAFDARAYVECVSKGPCNLQKQGHAFYPRAGLIATNDDAGQWIDDAISGGGVTLAQLSEKDFDILFTDSSGRVVSALQDGGVVVFIGAANKAISVAVSYPSTTVVETYTFLRNADGKAEVIWTSNKGGGAPILKAAAYRADCSFFYIQ